MQIMATKISKKHIEKLKQYFAKKEQKNDIQPNKRQVTRDRRKS